LGQALGGLNAFRQTAAGEKWLVDVSVADGIDHFLFVSPELELVRSLASKRDGERRAPGSSADHCDSCHENLYLSCAETAFSASQQAFYVLVMTDNHQQCGGGAYCQCGRRKRIP